MSLFRTLDRTPAVSNTTSARPFLSFLWPILDKKTFKRSFSNKAIDNAPRLATPTARMDAFFIQALVRASSCPKHAKRMPTMCGVDAATSRKYAVRWSSTWSALEDHTYNARPQRRGPFNKVKAFAEKELQALVDYYGMKFDNEPEQDISDDGKLVWNVGDSHESWPLRDPSDAVHITKLEKLLEDDEASHEEIFETYKKLPSPGVVYLKIETIRVLLHHLAVVERPVLIAVQRYLSILDDMKTAHIHILRSEWTSAMHLSGNALGKLPEDRIQSALQIWRDMEHRAGIRGGYVAFNVLFTVSVKTGKYNLAETFLKEMQARKMPMHRHHRVSLLYYYGVLQNGNAVRRTYQELISAGEIVDTVVMNAVIASLLRAGEPSAAEHVFERMKRLHSLRASPAPGHTFFNRKWRDRRLLGMHFRDEVQRLSKDNNEEELKQLQDFAPIAPDSRTYGILIRHHAGIAGNIDRVHELLQEMKWNSVPLEGTIFIVIFHGFNTFGGVRYSSWTASKLEKIWQRYLKALNEELERTWISSLSVIAALRAFAKCTDSERTLRAWEEIRNLWHDADEQELESVLLVLRKLVPIRLEVPSPGFFDFRRPF